MLGGALVAVAMLAGCGPEHRDPVTTTAATSPTTTTAITSPTDATPATQDCSKVYIDDKPPLAEQHIRCTLQPAAGLTLAVSSDPSWSFELQRAGTTVQRFTEITDKIGQSGVAPLLADLDGTGIPSLLVVNGRGGTGGEPMAVWKFNPEKTEFVRAGEIFGFRHYYRSTEGLFGLYAHSGSGAGVVTLYRWDGDSLVAVVLLDVQTPEWTVQSTDKRVWLRNKNVMCTLNKDDYPAGSLAAWRAQLTAAGFDPATAAEHFCMQPWVGTLYR